MPTTNPVPSQDPSDLLFNAGKLDEVVNGASATYADRLGTQRRTLAGLEAEFPNAQANAVAAAASATAAAASATQAANGAASAATAVALAFAEATAAQAARTGAEAARDAAFAFNRIYSSVSAGLAAVGDGQYFGVPQSNGDAINYYLRTAGAAVFQESYTSWGVGVQIEQQRSAEKLAVDQLPATPIADLSPIDARLANRMVIPNRRNTQRSNNLYFWRTGEIVPQVAQGGLVQTKRFATGPAGGMTALRLQFVSSSSIWYLFNSARPAGTYQIRFKAKSNAGAGSQTFRHGVFNTGLQSVTVDESAWTTVTYTLTTNGTNNANYCIFSAATFVALDLLVDEFQVYDDGVPVPDFAAEASDVGNLHRAQTNSTYASIAHPGTLTVDGNELSPASGYFKLNRDFSNKTFSEMTVFALVREDAASAALASVLHAPDIGDAGYSKCSLGTELVSGVSYLSAKTPQRSIAPATKTGVKITGEGWQVIGMRWKNGLAAGHFHELEIWNSTGTTTGFSVPYLMGGGSGFNNANAFNGRVGRILVYDRYLSDGEVYRTVSHLRSIAALYNGYSSAPNNIYLAEGDSITEWNTTATGYAWRQRDLFNPTLKLRNFAIGGSKLADLQARKSGILRGIEQAKQGGRRAIVSVFIGANDTVAMANPTTYTAAIFAYCDELRAAGAKVILCTLLPNTLSSFNSLRGAVNTAIRAGVTHYDALCDFAADSTMGPDTAASDTSLYPDGLHPSDAGHVILAGLMQAKIASVML